MHLRCTSRCWMRWFVAFAFVAPSLAHAASAKPCVSADEASKLINKDVCISAHVYDVVELPNGTRFLDVCTPANARRSLPVHHRQPLGRPRRSGRAP